ncbi:MAG: hypothetical protein H8K08_03165 [Nitrospira sp.]|nr:hypothetical protein [Nitrospira sp.]
MESFSNDPPFNPVRARLYSSRELLTGFVASDPDSITRTPDFLSYIYFERQGRTIITDPYTGMMEAVHDASISRGLHQFLTDHGRPPVAIMGGHAEPRNSQTYADVVLIAKKLSEEGFVVASGGGPGCMEATHLGALLAGRSNSDVAAALAQLAPQATLPKDLKDVFLFDVLTQTWKISTAKAREMHAWALPAVQLAEQLSRDVTDANYSLAIPTWHYGHEPLSPFATHVAKYFLNSIREDVLLAIAKNGIIFTKGRSGTLQEVFQDAAQNYYRDKKANEPFSPMIFFNTSFWANSPSHVCDPDPKNSKLPVKELLHSLFVCTGNSSEVEFEKYVCFSDDVDWVVRHLIECLPKGQKRGAAELEVVATGRQDLVSLVRKLSLR